VYVYFAMLGGAPGAPALPEDELQRLVGLAREGDSTAKQRLYEQLVHRVFRTVRSMFASEAEAEDVTQDALLKVLTSLDRYRPRPESRFVSWVLAIAVNTARRRFRRRRPVPTDPGILAALVEDDSGAAELDEEIDAKRRRAVVLRALWQVPEREREVIALRYGAELKAPEVADICGLSAANVRKMCERLRTRLRDQIEAELAEGGSHE